MSSDMGTTGVTLEQTLQKLHISMTSDIPGRASAHSVLKALANLIHDEQEVTYLPEL